MIRPRNSESRGLLPCPLRNWVASQFPRAQACSMPTTRTGITVRRSDTPLSKCHPRLSMTLISWFIKAFMTS
jgi:hypothetical protein